MPDANFGEIDIRSYNFLRDRRTRSENLQSFTRRNWKNAAVGDHDVRLGQGLFIHNYLCYLLSYKNRKFHHKNKS